MLAERFEQVYGELAALVERCGPTGWRATCADVGWTVGVTVHHVAATLTVETDALRAVATGQRLPPIYSWEWDAIHEWNAQHAERHAACTKAETLDLLRRDGAEAASVIRGLSDEQLDRAARIPVLDVQWSAEQVVQRILIGHAEDHLPGIRAVIASRRALGD